MLNILAGVLRCQTFVAYVHAVWIRLCWGFLSHQSEIAPHY